MGIKLQAGKTRVETTPRVLLRWSHYPRVCGPWFGSYPPHQVGSNSIAAFSESVADHLSRDDSRHCTYHRPSGRSGELLLMCGFIPTPPGLRPSGASIALMGWRIELFHSSRRTPLGVFADDNQLLFSGAATCDDACVQWLSQPFGLRNATHHLSFTCRLLDGISRPRPHVTAAGASRSASLPLSTRLGHLTLPLAMLVRRLVRREVGTTRYSPAADVPRFRASKPPFVPRHLHCHDDHSLERL
jgi:hypothetical protein